MSPELLTAVKERIQLGHSESDIKDELRTAGYDEGTITAAYTEAQSEEGNSAGVESESVTNQESGQKATLQSATTLFSNGWTYALSRLDLVGLLSVPLVVVALIGYLSENTEQPAVIIGAAIISIAAMIFYFLNIAALLFTVSSVNERKVEYSEALAWAKRHFWGLVWIYILTVLVVYGGFLLLIIPGIIISFYVYFSQYVFVKEGVRGINALLRSRDLVKDNWWAFVGRLLVLSIIFFFVFIAIGLVVGLVGALSGENEITELVIAVGFQVLGAGATVIGMHAGMSLYSSLAQVRPKTEQQSYTGRGKYITLAWLGLALPLVGILAAVTLAVLGELGEYDLEEVQYEIQDNIDAKERAYELRSE